ncbi:MAG: YdeI/OmpD-associated family protein [Acidimicrobiales bacterium]
MPDRSHAYTTTAVEGPKKRVMVPVPFEPDDAWGAKPQHPVAGTVNGMQVRAVVEPLGDGWGIVLGAAWRRDCGVAAGEVVDVVLEPEGPQRDDLAPDLAAALTASPAAGAFFDGLAQFYRRAYLRWIDATKGRPEVREERIATVVNLLEAGVKERPKG